MKMIALAMFKIGKTFGIFEQWYQARLYNWNVSSMDNNKKNLKKCSLLLLLQAVDGATRNTLLVVQSNHISRLLRQEMWLLLHALLPCIFFGMTDYNNDSLFLASCLNIVDSWSWLCLILPFLLIAVFKAFSPEDLSDGIETFYF